MSDEPQITAYIDDRAVRLKAARDVLRSGGSLYFAARAACWSVQKLDRELWAALGRR